MIHFDRDPNSRKLEMEVNSKLEKIFNDLEPKREKPLRSTTRGVNFVSVEDALKELLDMGVKVQ